MNTRHGQGSSGSPAQLELSGSGGREQKRAWPGRERKVPQNPGYRVGKFEPDGESGGEPLKRHPPPPWGGFLGKKTPRGIQKMKTWEQALPSLATHVLLTLNIMLVNLLLSESLHRLMATAMATHRVNV